MNSSIWRPVSSFFPCDLLLQISHPAGEGVEFVIDEATRDRPDTGPRRLEVERMPIAPVIIESITGFNQMTLYGAIGVIAGIARVRQTAAHVAGVDGTWVSAVCIERTGHADRGLAQPSRRQFNSVQRRLAQFFEPGK
jgi:hypothetical protein